MKRRLLNLATLLSLLLCVAAGALWARSYRPVLDHVAWRGHTTLMVESRAGRIWFERWRGVRPVPTRPSRLDVNWLLLGTVNSTSGRPIEIGYSIPVADRHNGFSVVSIDWAPLVRSPATGELHAVGLPWWPFLSLSLLLPMQWTVTRLRRLCRRAAGHCPHCGYDLRATPGRCPECGTASSAVS